MTARETLDSIKAQTSRLLTDLAWPETPEERMEAEGGITVNIAHLTAALEAVLEHADRWSRLAEGDRYYARRIHTAIEAALKEQP